ncbi:uncharacterized protein LOC110437367 [Sorghum bicolor]|uniref:uncharacterized protein LOC110437367 n=1 Tax=Sorghum bicolor TaxID=4558 RepID=UPI000B423EBC|nr:uncharacterized protein LOC110437367 [Sorghum bicolor]|eukprot:XP_021321496.1 uncharacterized protein LOC110437367 [Sorghum bicolor]
MDATLPPPSRISVTSSARAQDRAAQSATASDCDGEEGAGRRRCEVHRQPRGGGSPITSRRRGDETESGRGSGRCACAGEQQHSLRTGKLAVAARSPGAVKAGDECRGPEALLRSSSPPLLSRFFFSPRESTAEHQRLATVNLTVLVFGWRGGTNPHSR